MALPGIPYEQRLLIMAEPREKALQDYRKKLLEHKEIDGRLKECEWREEKGEEPGGRELLTAAHNQLCHAGFWGRTRPQSPSQAPESPLSPH